MRVSLYLNLARACMPLCGPCSGTLLITIINYQQHCFSSPKRIALREGEKWAAGIPFLGQEALL